MGGDSLTKAETLRSLSIGQEGTVLHGTKETLVQRAHPEFFQIVVLSFQGFLAQLKHGGCSSVQREPPMCVVKGDFAILLGVPIFFGLHIFDLGRPSAANIFPRLP